MSLEEAIALVGTPKVGDPIEVSPPIRVRFKKNVRDGRRLHARAGDTGEVRYIGAAGLMVWLDNGGRPRQVLRHNGIETEIEAA